MKFSTFPQIEARAFIRGTTVHVDLLNCDKVPLKHFGFIEEWYTGIDPGAQVKKMNHSD